MIPFDRYLFPWLGINVNEALIRNFLILKVTVESVAEAIAAQPRSLNSLAKVLDNRIDLDCILAEQGVCLRCDQHLLLHLD